MTIDLEKTSIGRASKLLTLREALETLMDNVIENMDQSTGRSVSPEEVNLIKCMMRVNRFIRITKIAESNPVVNKILVEHIE